MSAVVALDTGEPPEADSSDIARRADWAAIARTTSASVFSCRTLLPSQTWQTAITSGANISFVSFVAFGAEGTRGATVA